IIAGALAIGVVAVGVGFGTMSASGSDAYGYVSQAELWLNGRLTTPQPWADQAPWPTAPATFAPLGYQTQAAYEPIADHSTIVPTYAPGLPLLMAGAKVIAGNCAIYWVVPMCGGVMVLATFGIGRRLGSSRAGLIAAWLV